MRRLSRIEAVERAALLAVHRYDIEVDLTGLLSGTQLRCRSTVRFSCRQPGAATFVDCCAEVVSATLNGEPLAAAVDGRIPLRPLRVDNVLVVVSVQGDTSRGLGVHRAVDPADGEVYVWTSFEPDDARYVWACFDQPDLKAPYALTVSAPAGWSVLSNAEYPKVDEPAAGVRRWVFPLTRPLSSYLPVVLAGPFCELRRTLAGYDLGLFARQSFRQRLERDATELFALTGQGLEFFAEMFGSPFRDRTYDQVFLPEFGGAMENDRCVAWGDSFLPASAPTHAEQEHRALYLLHELAHMWFGNLVTLRWWGDLWLNEAFAHFAAMWAAERASGYPGIWAAHLVRAKLVAYRVDQSPATYPIAQPVDQVGDQTPVYAITYTKGASVLRQLVAFVGEHAFTSGLRAYLAEHAGGNASLADLIGALQVASGRDLQRWSHDWLQTTEPDRLTLAEQDQGLMLLATGPRGRTVRPQVVSVGAYRRTAEGLARVADVDVEVSAAATAVDLPSGADLYLANDRDLTYATTRPRAEDRDLLLREAAALPTSLARAVAVSCGYDMLLAGEAGTALVLDNLFAVVARESSPSLVEPYLQLAVDLAEHWSSDPLRARLMRRVASSSAALTTDPAHRRVALRVLAGTASQPELDELEQARPDDLDVQWRVLCRRAELSGPTGLTGGHVDRLLSRDPNPEAWILALTVQACSGAQSDKAAVWELLAEQRTVPIAHVSSVAAAFWRPGQDDVLVRYAERFLELIPNLHRDGTLPAQGYSRWLYPLHGVAPEYPDRADGTAATTVPAVRNGVRERSDLVRRMLRARAE